MGDSAPDALRCVGGPHDGEELQNWQTPDDTYEVANVEGLPTQPTIDGVSYPIAGNWASFGGTINYPGARRLGHYRLDFDAGRAVWVPDANTPA